MDYQILYEKLIERGRTRTSTPGYSEKHHIVPRCLGGSDNPENIVVLTAREHYIAHLILVRIYPDHSGLVHAANMMANLNSRSFSWARDRHARLLSVSRVGFSHSEETRIKMSDAIRERWDGRHEEYRQEQRRRALSPKRKLEGYRKPKSDEHRLRIAAAALKRPKVACEVCGKLITKANISNHQKVHTR